MNRSHDTDPMLPRLAVLAALHLPLGFVLARSPTLASLHALICLFVGLRWALDIERPDRVAWAAAYITGADVLWRMCNATVFHQFGKYSVVLICVIWILRSARYKGSFGPACYFLALLPSISVATDIADLAYIKGRVSFNLSGPLALAVAVIFFRQLELRRKDVVRIMLCCVVAVVAVYGVSLSSTMAADTIVFTHESNFVTSGGFGPNQVSATLGLGVLLLLLIPMLTRLRARGTLLVFAGILALGTQAAITFSRGGLYSAAGALLAALPFFISVRRLRRRVLMVAAGLSVIGLTMVLPGLNEYTGGMFTERMGETRMAGREELMVRDLALWNENVVLGVGPGMSRLSRIEGVTTSIAHTEFTRMVAEHGLLGALSILILFGITLGSIRAAPAGVQRAMVVAFVCWTMLFMMHAAMRLAAPGFLIGLAAAVAATPKRVWESA